MKLPCAPSPRTRPGLDTKQSHAHANMTAGACCSIKNMHMPTRPLRPQRVESAEGVRHRGSYTAPLGRQFEAGGPEVGGCSSGMCRSGMGGCSGRLLYPINWGLRSYMDRSEAYEPVTVSSLTSHSPAAPEPYRAHANHSPHI
jgi:hypothetical protein